MTTKKEEGAVGSDALKEESSKEIIASESFKDKVLRSCGDIPDWAKQITLADLDSRSEAENIRVYVIDAIMDLKERGDYYQALKHYEGTGIERASKYVADELCMQ